MQHIECDKNLKISVIFVIDSTLPREDKHVVGRQGDAILQHRNSLFTLRRRISVAMDTHARVTHVYPVCAREANLHVNIFRENKSIRMREEELLKLVIAVYEAASAFIRHRVAELRNSVTSFGDNAARKHPVTRYRMSRVCRDIPPCSQLICKFKCTRTLLRLRIAGDCLEICRGAETNFWRYSLRVFLTRCVFLYLIHTNKKYMFTFFNIVI